jgi:D-aspartate ligase
MARETSWPHVIVMDPFTAGLAIARRMVRLGARVTVFLEPDDPYVARSRGVHTVVAPFGDGSDWLARLLELASVPSPAVALPASDRCCELLVSAADRLPPNLLAFERDGHAHLALMDKDRADRLARSAGVRVPWTMKVTGHDELASAVADAPWPCVIKPILSHEWRARHGEQRVFLVHDAQEAESLLRGPIEERLGMLLSQYIPGGDEDVEEAILVRLADGSYPVQFGCRKLRQHPPGFGVTAVGEASPLPETMALARAVLDEAGFVGVAGVETKRHAETDERWFLEVNVRIPGQWSLGDACGAQATPRLVAALAGASLGPQPPVRDGVRIVLPDVDAHVVWPALLRAPLWRRPLIALRMLRIYSGARDFGVLDPRDPGPAFAFVSLLARRRIANLYRRICLRKPSGRAAGDA